MRNRVLQQLRSASKKDFETRELYLALTLVLMKVKDIIRIAFKDESGYHSVRSSLHR